MVMNGHRIHPKPDEDWIHNLQPGDYGCAIADDGAKHWYARTPNGLLGNLGQHQVTEHEDGAITVSPSILVHASGSKPEWHGFLERGVWRSC
jgi:hypothetical protein